MPSPTHRLTLRVSLHDGRPVTPALLKVFDERGGTIGRAAQNDWVLPDPSRFLSAHHATVYFQGGAFRLVDCSTNGIYLNGDSEPMGAGCVADLAEGDTLQFGDYELIVSIVGLATRLETPVVTPPATGAPDPLQRLEADADGPAPAAVNTPSHQTPWFDAGRPASSRVSEAAVGESAIVDPLALLSPRGDVDRSQSAEGVSNRDDAPMLASFFQAPAVAAAPVPEDWFKTGITIAPVVQQAASQASPSRAAQPPANAPEPVALPMGRPTVVAAAEATGTASLRPALDLLLRAAGLDPARTPRHADPRQTLQTIGSVLHDALAALRELMLQRSTTRQRLGLAATCITPRDNNPLKFSARGVAEVIDGFLFEHGPACLDAGSAIREALQDLKARHDEERLALLHGLRAQLDRIDPQLIERSCNEPRRLRLGSGKSDCWALYVTRHAELRRHLNGHAETSPPTPLPRRRAAVAAAAIPSAEFSHGLE